MTCLFVASAFLRLLTRPSEDWAGYQLFPHADYAATFALTLGLGEGMNGTAVGFYRDRGAPGAVLRGVHDFARYKLVSVAGFSRLVDDTRRREAEAATAERGVNGGEASNKLREHPGGAAGRSAVTPA